VAEQIFIWLSCWKPEKQLHPWEILRCSLCWGVHAIFERCFLWLWFAFRCFKEVSIWMFIVLSRACLLWKLVVLQSYNNRFQTVHFQVPCAIILKPIVLYLWILNVEFCENVYSHQDSLLGWWNAIWVICQGNVCINVLISCKWETSQELHIHYIAHQSVWHVLNGFSPHIGTLHWCESRIQNSEQMKLHCINAHMYMHTQGFLKGFVWYITMSITMIFYVCMLWLMKLDLMQGYRWNLGNDH